MKDKKILLARAHHLLNRADRLLKSAYLSHCKKAGINPDTKRRSDESKN